MRLGEFQAELRAAGVPVNAVLAPYKGAQHDEPTLEEQIAFAESYIDAEDPERNYPVLLTSEAELQDLIPWDGGHPKHCILSAEREIVWCQHGHNLEDVVRDKLLELSGVR